MTASEVIHLFVEISGRYDLLVASDDEVPVDVPSAQAYFYLNAAQRWLDRELGEAKQAATFTKAVLVNETEIEFAHPRYVTAVFDGNSRVLWRPASFDIDELPELSEAPEKKIIVAASNQARSLTIHAVWKSPVMTGPDDVSFWTLDDQDLLLRAMQLCTEHPMRNSAGVRDIWEPLRYDVRQIRHDLAAEEMAGTTEEWRMT